MERSTTGRLSGGVAAAVVLTGARDCCLRDLDRSTALIQMRSAGRRRRSVWKGRHRPGRAMRGESCGAVWKLVTLGRPSVGLIGSITTGTRLKAAFPLLFQGGISQTWSQPLVL